MKEGQTEAQIREELRDILGLDDYSVDRAIFNAKRSYAKERSAKRNPTASPQARGFTFMHSEMNEEWANWALARQGIQHRGQGYGPGSFPVGARLNPKYRFSAKKHGKGYVVTVHGPDGDDKYRVDGLKGGKKEAIEAVRAEVSKLHRGSL